MLEALLLCACPPAASIADIPTEECTERLGQIQKLIFQRTKDGATTNEITIATTNPNLLATWTALQTADDNTKVQSTPYIGEPTSEAGEAREFGGGNATLGGITINLGRNPSTFEAKFYDVKQVIMKALKGYECEKELSVFFVNEGGQLIGQTDDPTTPTIFKGIPIRSFFLSDKKLGGFEEPDMNMLKFQMLPNWSDYLHIVTPVDFNGLDL